MRVGVKRRSVDYGNWLPGVLVGERAAQAEVGSRTFPIAATDYLKNGAWTLPEPFVSEMKARNKRGILLRSLATLQNPVWEVEWMSTTRDE